MDYTSTDLYRSLQSQRQPLLERIDGTRQGVPVRREDIRHAFSAPDDYLFIHPNLGDCRRSRGLGFERALEEAVVYFERANGKWHERRKTELATITTTKE